MTERTHTAEDIQRRPVSEMRATDVAEGTRFEVEAQEGGTFRVRVFYPGTDPSQYYDGEGLGETFTEAASRAIADAEGETEETGTHG